MRNYDYDDNDEFKNEIDKFWHGDDDDDEEDDEDDEDEEFEEEYGYSKQEILKAMELEVLEMEVDLKVLALTIRTLERSFLWRFYGFQTKLKMIVRMYVVLSKLMSKEGKKEIGEG